MKKKGLRSIPDFSNKRKVTLPGGAPVPQAEPAKTRREPIAKPHSTSVKSGRRGS